MRHKTCNTIISVTFIKSEKHAIDCVTNEEQSKWNFTISHNVTGINIAILVLASITFLCCSIIPVLELQYAKTIVE